MKSARATRPSIEAGTVSRLNAFRRELIDPAIAARPIDDCGLVLEMQLSKNSEICSADLATLFIEVEVGVHSAEQVPNANASAHRRAALRQQVGTVAFIC
jgi:hypothetical protein